MMKSGLENLKSWNFRPLILTILGSGLTIIIKMKSFLESSSNCLATKIWYWSLLIILKSIFKAKNRAQSLIWWLILQITVPIVFVGLFFWPWYLFKWVTLTHDWQYLWIDSALLLTSSNLDNNTKSTVLFDLFPFPSVQKRLRLSGFRPQ